MKTRLITALVAFLVFLPFLVIPFSWVYPLAILIISFIAIFEMFRCCSVHKNIFFTLPYFLAAAVTPFLISYQANQNQDFPLSSVLLLGILFLVLWAYPPAIFSKGRMPVSDACTAALGALYILAGLNATVYIRQGIPYGDYVFLMVFLGAWFTDSAAYFCGRAFGKYKLIPDVSPKKTVEGSIGGVIVCMLLFAVYALLIQFVFSKGTVVPNYVAIIVSAFFISAVSQVGDLAMSLLKRHYGIKDFGRIMPGHGGFVDRFDSVIAVAIMLMICYAFFDTIGMQFFAIKI